MKQKVAIVTGCVGQTGSYLAELLIDKGYRVIGTKRRTSSPNYENISNILTNDNFQIETADITDYSSVSGLIEIYKPDEIYNLAAQSFVKASFDQPFHTFDTDTIGVLNFLEVIRKQDRPIKFYQASTSEMFGSMYSCEREYDQYEVVEHFNIKEITPRDLWAGIGKYHDKETRLEKLEWLDSSIKAHEEYPDIYGDMEYCRPKPFQNEDTPFLPQSPYGIAKLAAHHLCRLYRDSYGIFAACGILFNHESPRRGKEFVTRKITDYVGKLSNEIYKIVIDKKTLRDFVPVIKYMTDYPKLKLGNLDAYRDWGYAPDYARAQHLILQQDKPDDFVICTGKSHTVREFCKAAFDVIGMNYEDWVEVDPQFYRPAEVDYLCGDSSKANKILGWEPEHTFEQMIKDMVESDTKCHAKR